MERLRELYSTWTFFRPALFSIGLRTKAPLGHDASMRGLTSIGQAFPELDQSRFDEKSEKFILETLEPDTDRQFLIRLVNYKSVEMAWGPGAAVDLHDFGHRLFEAVQEGFGLQIVNVELIDMKFVALSNWEGHHYQAIFEAFLASSPLSGLSEAAQILQDDLSFRAIVDEHRVCAIGVESNVADAEVLTARFRNDTLRASAGVAQVRGIPHDARLSSIFAEHSEVALSFFCERFVPNVIVPLDEACARLAEG